MGYNELITHKVSHNEGETKGTTHFTSPPLRRRWRWWPLTNPNVWWRPELQKFLVKRNWRLRIEMAAEYAVFLKSKQKQGNPGNPPDLALQRIEMTLETGHIKDADCWFKCLVYRRRNTCSRRGWLFLPYLESFIGVNMFVIQWSWILTRSSQGHRNFEVSVGYLMKNVWQTLSCDLKCDARRHVTHWYHWWIIATWYIMI